MLLISATLQEALRRFCSRYYVGVRLGVCLLHSNLLVQRWWHLRSSRHLRGSELPRLEPGSAVPVGPAMYARSCVDRPNHMDNHVYLSLELCGYDFMDNWYLVYKTEFFVLD